MREIIQINGGRVLRDEEIELKINVSLSLTLENQGREAWAWLHKEAKERRLTRERLIKEFEPMIPKYGCSCLYEYQELLKQIPFRVSDQIAWAEDIHNAVNKKLSKPLWPY
jgi:hypothetical protein